MIRNKKAISEMVGYVLLVVIAISLSILVYSFLKQYLPSDREECSPDISLAIENVACNVSTRTLTIELSNRGHFTIKGFYVKMGLLESEASSVINQNQLTSVPLLPSGNNTWTSYNIYNFLNNQGMVINPQNCSKNFKVKVQPVIISQKGKITPCDSSSSQIVTCRIC